MRKFNFLLAILILLAHSSFSQQADTSYRTHSVKPGINFNQANFNKNWKGGGSNSLAMGASLPAKLNYVKEKVSWDNTLDLHYSILKNEGQDARKSNDKLLFDTKLGYAVSDNWNVFASLNFLTQFDKGYEYGTDENGAEMRTQISGFMAPAFITSALGMEYKPNAHFNLRLSPFSPRITIVNDTTLYNQVPENFGVTPGETVRYEWLAFKLSASYDKDVIEGLNVKAGYDFFVNYEELNPEKFDHRFELAVTSKIYKVLNVGINTIVLYDFDQIDKVQASFSTSLSMIFEF